MDKVKLHEVDGRWTLTLNDPDRRNAIGEQLRADLLSAIATVGGDRSARTLVVTGAGTSFCSGADVESTFGDTSRSVAEIRRDLRAVYDCFTRVRSLPFPTIAAVQGPAVGAGLNLAMACDVRVAGPEASFAATFTKIGLHPGGGCTWFLVKCLGPERALALLLDGGSLTAGEALDAGLALTVADDPVAAAAVLAQRWSSVDQGLAQDIKTAVRAAVESDFERTLQLESWAQAASVTSPAVQEYVAKLRKS